jgi:type II secretory pathway component PulK
VVSALSVVPAARRRISIERASSSAPSQPLNANRLTERIVYAVSDGDTEQRAAETLVQAGNTLGFDRARDGLGDGLRC